MDEPTDAWADINPPMVSARPPAPPTEYLDPRQPASNTEFRDELTACLALVCPVGMTEEAKGEWLSVAWITLSHLPSDILAAGCRKARETCDHPSKIVPAIIAETEDWVALRQAPRPTMTMIAGPVPPPRERHVGQLMDARGHPMTDGETETLNAHLERLGSPARYRADGSKMRLTHSIPHPK